MSSAPRPDRTSQAGSSSAPRAALEPADHDAQQSSPIGGFELDPKEVSGVVHSRPAPALDDKRLWADSVPEWDLDRVLSATLLEQFDHVAAEPRRTGSGPAGESREGWKGGLGRTQPLVFSMNRRRGHANPMVDDYKPADGKVSGLTAWVAIYVGQSNQPERVAAIAGTREDATRQAASD